ncbi:hypothetical protein AB8810_15935 [Xanthomonas sp. NCPPB 3005]|uniref:hypothetical protein n=1 Tax=Xanthomonas sp. NCPPB 3005 TaxID=3240913 RepID=UPI003513CA78
MQKTLFLMSVASMLLAGCSTYDTRLSSRSLRSNDNQNLGTVFVWDNDVSAAVAYPPSTTRTTAGDRQTGRAAICMQRAMTAGATAMKGDLSVSDSFLTLAKLPGAQGGDLGKVAVNLSESVLALSVSTERTAFIDTALFYLCQMAANGSLSDDHLSTAVTTLIETAGALASSSAEPKSQAAPILPNTVDKPAGATPGAVSK